MVGLGSFGVVIAVPVLLGILSWGVLKGPTYVFQPETLQRIVKTALETADAGNLSSVIQHTIAGVRAEYPAHYLIPDQEWVFNNAGGAMGSMIVLHSSLSEYLIVFGSAIGTDGHTGRFFADDYFTIMYGEQWAFAADSTEKEIYRPGDQHHLVRGTAKAYRMPDTCYALEYARGNMLSMLPFGFADSFFSTLDPLPVMKTIRISLASILRNLRQSKI